MRLTHNGVKRLVLQLEFLEDRTLPSASPLLTSWMRASPSGLAQVISGTDVAAGPRTTWPTNPPEGSSFAGGEDTPTPASVQRISYSATAVYVETPDFASYVMGPWFLDTGKTEVFPNFPSDQHQIQSFTRSPQPATTHSLTPLGQMGLFVNGVSMFNMLDGFSWDHSQQMDLTDNPAVSDTLGGDGYWNRDANYAEQVTFDEGNAHTAPSGDYHYHSNPTALRAQLHDNIAFTGTDNLFPYDPTVTIHPPTFAHTVPYEEDTTNLHHSPLLGWANDGYPVYGPYGYADPSGSNGAIERMTSSYRLRNITERTSLPGWAAQVKFGDNVTLDASGEYPLPAEFQGPPVSADHPLGEYVEDYEYDAGLGTLDKYNGRFTVTPEYPRGTYAYFVTVDSSEKSVFPYEVGRQYFGVITQRGGPGPTTISEPTTTFFDVNQLTPNLANVPPGIMSFLDRQYEALLGRLANDPFVAYWANGLSNGSLTTAQVVQGILNSPEYQMNLLADDYDLTVGRQPDQAGLDFFLPQMQAGVSNTAILAQLLRSAEFQEQQSGTFIEGVYHTVLGRDVTPQEQAFWDGAVQQGDELLSITMNILGSAEAAQRQVQDKYQSELDRPADSVGFSFWVPLILNDPFGPTLIGGILSSREFAQGFGL